MIEILDCHVDVHFPSGQHTHCLVAQLPVRLERAQSAYVSSDPEGQWRSVRSVLDVVAGGGSGIGKAQLLVFPEGCLPLAHLDDLLSYLATRLRPSTVTMIGLEHVRLSTYHELLVRFREDNPRALEQVQKDLDTGSAASMPVNLCCIAVKEQGGRLRVFLEAKGHPFHGEESLDKSQDLYQGQHVYFFRCQPSFNFMVLICVDYLHRDLYSSNIRRIVDHADRLYFATRHTLDALFVVQCNPKPEHRAYREVLSGFYGEYLEDTPGVRQTVTVFGNCSSESSIDGSRCESSYGLSSAVIGNRHPRAGLEQAEFSTDDYGGAPVHRLRFGTATRLYSFNLPLHHELDPRSVRMPLKVHGILRPIGDHGWQKMSLEEMREGPGLGGAAIGPGGAPSGWMTPGRGPPGSPAGMSASARFGEPLLRSEGGAVHPD
jgi:hypothetical protein